MISTLLAILAVSTIGAGLAAVLVIADRFISDYGECEITINSERRFRLRGGVSLLEALGTEKVFIPSACGGRGSCGFCKVTVPEGAGPILPTEEPYLGPEEKGRGVRLSCQVKVRNDLGVEVPQELFAVREYTCRVEEIRELTYDTRQFRLELEEPGTIDYVPGQYVQVLAPAYKGNPEEVYRAYSIASDPVDKGAVELIVRRAPNGICTTYLFDHLKTGDRVKINGPYGDFRLSETDAPIIFIAGGSGMAPIKCMLHHMVNTGCTRPAIYYFGVNEMRDLYFEDEIKKQETALPGFGFVPVVAQPGNGWSGETGLVTEALERNLEDASEYEAYLCGSPGMIDACIKVLSGLGLPEERIYFDKF